MDRIEPKLVTIFGGSGFVGTQIVQLLAKRGHRIRVAVRRPDLAGHVKMFGSVGQVQPIQANVRNAASVRRAVAGVDIVINLAGVGYSRGAQTFQSVHVTGAGNVAEAARAAGVSSLVHMSALGADRAADVSAYAASKLAGEAAVLEAFLDAVIMRPSILFGQESLNNEGSNGGRVTAGWWWDPNHCHAFEGDVWGLDVNDDDFRAVSPGSPILARPYFDLLGGTEGAELVAFPGIVRGSVAVDTDTTVWGAGLRKRWNICGMPDCDPCWSCGWRRARARPAGWRCR